MLKMTIAAVLSALLLLVQPASAQDTNDEALWAALQEPGTFGLMRHALAPGFGDPASFDVERCDTQRNLSDEGRQQASAVGSSFRQNHIVSAKIYSSQWCRCRETAELLGLGAVTELPLLNSFFADRAQRVPQTQALRQWLMEQPLDTPLVLVTHQVNITALTDVSPASGEMVIMRRSPDGTLQVLGSLLAQ